VGPWQGLSGGAVEDLKPHLRLQLAEQGFALVYQHSRLEPDLAARQMATHAARLLSDLRITLDEVVTINKRGRSTSTVNCDLIVFVSGRGEPIDILAHSCLA
jgi:hypothetical protein